MILLTFLRLSNQDPPVSRPVFATTLEGKSQSTFPYVARHFLSSLREGMKLLNVQNFQSVLQ